ncbi:hypothetical protein C8R46DRAFT_1121534, partial [Mycena filopes]
MSGCHLLSAQPSLPLGPTPQAKLNALPMSSRSDFAVFDYNWLVAEVSSTCVQVFAYAIYLNLFILSLRTLRRRNVTGNNIFVASIWAMGAMGILVTAQIVLRLFETAVVLRFKPSRRPSAPAGAYDSLRIAQALCRSYAVWSSRRTVIVVLAIFVVATGVPARAGLSPGNAQIEAILLASATNICLTMLTAGRVWWLRQPSRESGNRYTTVTPTMCDLSSSTVGYGSLYDSPDSNSVALSLIPAILVTIVTSYQHWLSCACSGPQYSGVVHRRTGVNTTSEPMGRERPA